jgi:Uma2 family endonuclease
MMSTAVAIQQKQTYEDYLVVSEENPLMRVELLEGEIVMAAAPRPMHQYVLRNLALLLTGYVQLHHLGDVLFAPIGVRLAEDVFVQPDLLFLRRERVAAVVGETYLEGSPDFVVEILSPGTAHYDRHIKMQLYAQYGVAEYWIVDPDDQAIEVYVLDGNSYRVAGIFLEGETVDVGMFAAANIQIDAVFTH